jgi:hypothetical protein
MCHKTLGFNRADVPYLKTDKNQESQDIINSNDSFSVHLEKMQQLFVKQKEEIAILKTITMECHCTLTIYVNSFFF